MTHIIEYSQDVIAQVEAWKTMHAAAGQTRPLWLIVENGHEIPRGRVVEGNGMMSTNNGVLLVILWVPVVDARKPLDASSLSRGGSHVCIGQSIDGCVPINDEAKAMLAAISKFSLGR